MKIRAYYFSAVFSAFLIGNLFGTSFLFFAGIWGLTVLIFHFGYKKFLFGDSTPGFRKPNSIIKFFNNRTFQKYDTVEIIVQYIPFLNLLFMIIGFIVTISDQKSITKPPRLVDVRGDSYYGMSDG